MNANRSEETMQEADGRPQYDRQQEDDGTRPAEGEGANPMAPLRFQHSFWDPEIAPLRALYFKILGMTIILVIVMMWIAFPVYWGSLGETAQHVPNLKAWVINRDPNGALGTGIVQAFEANSQGQGVSNNMHLTWIVVDPSQYPTEADLEYAIVNEKTWAAVVVNTDATAALENARAAGNSSYNPQSAITFYYNQGRNEQAANTYIVPLTQQLLQTTLAKIGAQTTAQFLASAAQNAAGSAQALTAAAQAPATVAQPFAYSVVNLRPYTKTAAQALLLVGQIYITIFAFTITMAHDAARGIIAPYLRFGSYAKLRLFAPMVAYLPISLSYALVQLPFHLTLRAKFGNGGFFILWLFAFMGMMALGLSTEAMITILTPRFIAYFLVVLIIFNVSVGSVPIIMQPGFYRYGYGFPVYNLSQAMRTIIFNTKSHLGLNAGVLISWIALNFITVPLFTWYMRRSQVREVESPTDKEQQVAQEEKKL